jgi:hypothetical protein
MQKSTGRAGKAVVTFTLPAQVGARRVALCGDWNGWSTDADVLERTGEAFTCTVELEPGRTYRFRYLLDGERWENDWDADRYEPNDFGGDDSVVDLTVLDPPPSAGTPPAAAQAPAMAAKAASGAAPAAGAVKAAKAAKAAKAGKSAKAAKAAKAGKSPQAAKTTGPSSDSGSTATSAPSKKAAKAPARKSTD